MPNGLSESAKALNVRRKTKSIRSGGESVEKIQGAEDQIIN